MPRRAPRATLFPYTTLFRSNELKQTAVSSATESATIITRSVGELKLTATTSVAESAETDRKSTRLNSSHANISYAVFCLKKKKTNMNLSPTNERTDGNKHRR